MKRITSGILAFVAIVAFTSTVTAAYDTPVFIRGIRPLGMGGAFVALSDDQNAVFYNPAGLTQRKGSQFTLLEIPLNVSDDVFQVYNFYQDNEDKLKNFDSMTNVDDKISLINEIDTNMSKYLPAVRFGLPNTSYLSGSWLFSWGLGIFNQENFGFQFSRGMMIPSISFWGTADVMLAAPFAYKFTELPYDVPGTLSAGATAKYITRAKIEENNRTILEFENFDPQLQMGSGLGFDLGALYQPTDRWNVGLQITDLGGTTIKYNEVQADKAGQTDRPAYNSMIRSEWNVGAAYIPSRIPYWPGKSLATKDRLILLCDVRDILNTDERLLEATFFKKLHMGAEFRWGPASVRAGLNSGYPTFGIGARVPYLGLRADYAYWTDEKGRYAGQRPESNHQLTLAFSWGDSKGRAYGSAANSGGATVAAPKKKVKTVEKAPEVKENTAAVEQPAAPAKTDFPVEELKQGTK